MQGSYFEDLQVGQQATIAKTVTEADILLFSAVTMDTNPMHLNAEVAAAGFFGERVAHGMLTAGLISAVLGTRLPGPGAVYMSQSLRFTAPVRIGVTVHAMAEVIELIPEKKRARLRTWCTVADAVVVEGEALVMVPGRG